MEAGFGMRYRFSASRLLRRDCSGCMSLLPGPAKQYGCCYGLSGRVLARCQLLVGFGIPAAEAVAVFADEVAPLQAD